jgi:regulator of protease activity HflC (stomatin/prohibitin superfamily)
VTVDCYVNYKIEVPEKAIYNVVDIEKLVNNMTQGCMKTICAEHTLRELLVNRHVIEKKITDIIDKQTDDYGVKVVTIETQKITLPSQMERAMATVAESEKQAEARVIDAKGNFEASKIFVDAANELGKNRISLQLQYFETLKAIAMEKNSTIIVPDSIIGKLCG